MSDLTDDIPSGTIAATDVRDAVADLRSTLKTFDLQRSGDLLPYRTEVAMAISPDVFTRTNEMDRYSLVAAACVLKLIMDEKRVTWDNVEATLAKNPVVTLDESSEIERIDYLTKDGATSEFSHDGVVDVDTVNEMRSWLVKFFRSKQIISELQIDTEFCRDLISVVSACVDDLASSDNGEQKIHETKILNFGVLRFPDVEQHCFTIYQFELNAFIDTRKVLFDEVDAHGVSARFKSKRYAPRDGILRALNALTLDVAEKGARDFYNLMSEKASPISEQFPTPNVSDWPIIATTFGTLPTLSAVVERSRGAFDQYDVVKVAEAPMKCAMSVAFGDTSEAGVTSLTDGTVIAIASVHRMLKKCESITHKDLDETLDTSMFLYKAGDDAVMRHDKLNKDGHNTVCYEDGKTCQDVMTEVRSWINALIGDRYLIQQFAVDTESIVKVLEMTCRHHDYLGDLPEKQEYFSRDVVELACLRFPDADEEYFQLSYLKISAFSDCRRTMFDKKIRQYLEDLAKKREEKAANGEDDDDDEEGECGKIEFIGLNEATRAALASVPNADGNSQPDLLKFVSDVDEKADPEDERDPKELDTCGLMGEFQSSMFLAKLETTRLLSERVRNIAIRQGYAVFGLSKELNDKH